jgi:hypothetical protein
MRILEEFITMHTRKPLGLLDPPSPCPDSFNIPKHMTEIEKAYP